MMRIMVAGSFTARHSCIEGFPHQHTWHITVWFMTLPRADARLLREALDALLATWDGQTLPIGGDWNEDIAAAVSALPDCVEVRVWREADRLGVDWSR